MKYAHVGFVTAMAGITCTTFAHFAIGDFWLISYALAGLFGVLTAAIFGE